MLFVIDSSIGELFKRDIDAENPAISALENLAAARRDGAHIIYAEIDTLGVLVASPNLSERAKGVYRKVLSRVPQKKAYISTLSRHLVLVADDNVLEVSAQGPKRIIRASVKFFQSYESVQKTCLLTEDLRDSAFYFHMVKSYLTWAGLGTIQISFEAVHGGGGNTPNVYESIQSKNNRLCLCIVDSDRTYPTQNPGQVARALVKMDSPGRPFCEYHILRPRNIENLIPVALLRLIEDRNPEWVQEIDVVNDIERSPRPDAARFLNLKNGLKASDILYSKEEGFRRYWAFVLRPTPITGVNIQHRCTGRVTCAQKNRCKCIVMDGFGADLLSSTLAALQELGDKDIADKVDARLRNDWSVVGSLIAAWCCGSVPLYSS